jgi:large subunit ribosomal protein L25
VVGESTGVKNQSGVLEIATHLLRVRCLAKDLPAVVDIDVTELKVGETFKVGQIKPVPGVEFLDPKGQPVVSCVEPVAEVVVEAPVAAEAAVPVEGEAVPAEGAAAPAAGEGAKAAAPAGDAKAAAAAPGDKKAPAAFGDKKTAAAPAGDKKAAGAPPPAKAPAAKK